MWLFIWVTEWKGGRKWVGERQFPASEGQQSVFPGVFSQWDHGIYILQLLTRAPVSRELQTHQCSGRDSRCLSVLSFAEALVVGPSDWHCKASITSERHCWRDQITSLNHGNMALPPGFNVARPVSSHSFWREWCCWFPCHCGCCLYFHYDQLPPLIGGQALWLRTSTQQLTESSPKPMGWAPRRKQIQTCKGLISHLSRLVRQIKEIGIKLQRKCWIMALSKDFLIMQMWVGGLALQFPGCVRLGKSVTSLRLSFSIWTMRIIIIRILVLLHCKWSRNAIQLYC